MRFIAMQENSAGNESVGSEWIETASFDESATLSEVWEWAKGEYFHAQNRKGRLMVQLDDTSVNKVHDD